MVIISFVRILLAAYAIIVSWSYSTEIASVCPSLRNIIPCVHKQINNHCSLCLSKSVQRFRCCDKTNCSCKSNLDRSKGELPIYFIIAVPPNWGSSALEGLLATSPTVSTMCHLKEWQCESTWTLIKQNIFSLENRWDEKSVNWTSAYKALHSIKAWNNMNAPILLDKAPPNVAKSRSLIEYFQANNISIDYRFVIMRQHPCLIPSRHYKNSTLFREYTVHIRNTIANVPRNKRIVIDYHNFISRPDIVSDKLLEFLPRLCTLDIGRNGKYALAANETVATYSTILQQQQQNMNRDMRDASVLTYMKSKDCSLQIERQNVSDMQVLLDNLYGQVRLNSYY